MTATIVVVTEISFVFIAFLLFNGTTSEDPCKYEMPGKGIINLSSIGKIDGTPFWKDVPSEIATEDYGNKFSHEYMYVL